VGAAAGGASELDPVPDPTAITVFVSVQPMPVVSVAELGKTGKSKKLSSLPSCR